MRLGLFAILLCTLGCATRDPLAILRPTIDAFEIDPRQTLLELSVNDCGEVVGRAEHPQHARQLRRQLDEQGLAGVPLKIALLPEESKTDARFGIVRTAREFLRDDPTRELERRSRLSEVVLGEPVWILDTGPNDTLLVHAADGYLGHVPRASISVVSADQFAGAINANPASPAVDIILEQARQHLGQQYVWAGRSESAVDCSGLTQRSFAAVGVNLPRDADQQAIVGKLVGTRWFRDAIRPGDLLFFVGGPRSHVNHVAISLGNDRLIEAAGREDVRVRSLNPADADYDAELAASFAWARRVVE